MTSPNHGKAPPAPAAGQAARLPGAARDVTLHDQLYRYAEDLQAVMERERSLQQNCDALREACTRLSANRDMLDAVIGHSSDPHLLTDRDGRILQCNPAAAVLAPMPHLVGTLLRTWVQPSHRDNYDAVLAAALAGSEEGQSWELRLQGELPKGATLIVSAQVLPMQGNDGGGRLYWVLRDVTRLREIQFESQISSMVFNHTSEAVMITDIEGDILAVNPAFCRITGYSAEEAVGRSASLLHSGMHDAEFYESFWRSIQESGGWQGEIYNRRKNGEVFPEWLTVNAARDADGHVLSYIGVFTDLSRVLEAERRMAYLAHHDMLTGLPNRLLFQDRLEHALAHGRRSGSRFTLVFIDLDRFKQINDTLGHEVGDIVLKEAAARLSNVVREVDTVARLGGDEFVILAPELTGPEAIGIVCRKLIDALGEPMEIGADKVQIGGSLGCASYPDHGDTDMLLLRHADAAMYRAKAAGGNAHCIHAEQDGSVV